MRTREGRDSMSEPASQRLDKWLWYARLVKTRTLAAGLIEAGKFRVNRIKATRPSQTVKPGDVVTSSVHRDIRIYRVTATGWRRGPAAEAARLYEDISPPSPPKAEHISAPGPGVLAGLRERGMGRPTKRDRRRIERLLGKP